MPWTAAETRKLYLRMNAPWRTMLGNRSVRRQVQGVSIVVPRSHMLPAYAKVRPTYGQNLVELAQRIAAADGAPVHVIDVGANVGDSALQIVAAAPARVLCVEADPYWIDFLRRNVGSDDRIVVETALLTADEVAVAARPVRGHGTTRFTAAADEQGPADATLSVAALRSRNPDFEGVRLIKSDTDGYDTQLVPALAREWAASSPVLFFEYDPELTRLAGHDPGEVWAELAELGYEHVAVWDNAGDPLGSTTTADAAEHARSLEPKPVELGYHFWDVAVCRRDDAAGLEVLQQLVPSAFDARGARR